MIIKENNRYLNLATELNSNNSEKTMEKIAIVTGASRGLGKGIALALAKEAGYIVYATARNESALEILAKEASSGSRNGKVIPSVLDQNDDNAVESFVSNTLSNHKTINLLVNSAYGGLIEMTPHFGKPFWDRPISVYDQALNIGVRSAYVMSKFVAPIMVENQSGLIIQTTSTGGFHYVFDVAYGVGHAAMDRLTSDMALELETYNVQSITLSPVGGCQTEIVSFPDGESTNYVGRAVIALADNASQEDLVKMNGKVIFTAELAEKYKFFEDNDKNGEINQNRLNASIGNRKIMSEPIFHYQTKKTLSQYNSETLPFKLSESNSIEWADFFPGAKSK